MSPQAPFLTTDRAEVVRMLQALDYQARQVKHLARTAEQGLKINSYRSYLEFRRGIDEFRALVVLLEERLPAVGGDRIDALRQQFEQLDLLVMVMVVRVFKEFFTILSLHQVMPLGARELFAPDLDSLHEAELRLARPEYTGRVGADVAREIGEAAELMKTLLDRVPSLEDFDQPDELEEPML